MYIMGEDFLDIQYSQYVKHIKFLGVLNIVKEILTTFLYWVSKKT